MKKPHSLESSYFQKLETEMEKRAVCEKSHLEGFRTTAPNVSTVDEDEQRKRQRLYEEIFKCGNLTRHEDGGSDEYFRVLAEMENRYRRQRLK